MANNVLQIKRTSVSGRAANTTTLTNPGELALNMTDGIMYSTNGSVVFQIGANLTSIAVGNTTARFTANTLGAYHTGTVNAASHTVGTSFVANTSRVVIGTAVGLQANGGIGTAGQTLHSNGTTVYWATDDQGVTSIAAANGLNGGTITSTGTISVLGGSTLTVNTTGAHVNSALALTSLTSTSYVSVGNSTVNTYITGTQVQGNQNDTVSAPGYSWSTDNTTGIYRPAAATIGLAIAGVQELSVNATSFVANGLAFSGISTLAAGNTTITGFANVTSTLQVGGVATFAANANFDSGVLFVDGTNNRVGIGNTNPAATLHLQGNALVGGDGASNYDFKLQRLSSGVRAVQHDFAATTNSPWILHGENLSWTGERAGTVESTQAYKPYYEAYAPAVGYKEFGFVNATSGSFTTTNLIPNLVLASNGNVGLGTTSPAAILHTVSSASVSDIRAETTNAAGSVGLRTYLSGTNYTQFGESLSLNLSQMYSFVNPIRLRSPDYIAFQAGGSTERMRIDNSGNVGINTSTPGSTITVNGTASFGNTSITDLVVSGNLTVSGTRTYVNTTTLDVGDNIITLNADLGAVAPSENAGIEIMRGTSSNVQFIWDETNDRWSTNAQPLAVSSLIPSANIILGSAALSSNGSLGTAGHVLHSNGTATYWAADDQGVTSVVAANGLNGGTITSTGTMSVLGGSTLTVNTTGVHVNTALSLTSLAATSYVSVGNSTVNTYITGTQVQGNQNDTVSAPGYSWSTDTTTGIYRPAASTIGLAIAGVQELSVNATSFVANGLAFSGIGTLAAGNTTITGFANASVSVNSALLTVGTSFIANTTGVTTTGYVNASGTGYFGGDVTANGGQVYTSATQARVKLSVWDSTGYGIGMQTGYTYGGINNDYVMSFQMTDTGTSRGFWWGDAVHTNAQGAMALTTDGKLTVAHSARVGFGESDTTIPGSTYALEVNGAFAATTKSFLIDHPTKPGMKLRYGSLEGPENGVYVRGRLRAGENIIQLPDYWEGLVDEDTYTVNLTPVGKHQELYVKYIASDYIIVGGEDIDCFYTVFAERNDVEKLEVEF